MRFCSNSIVRLSCLALILAGIISPLIGKSESEDSNRFRGPDGSGIYSAHDLPVSWTDKDYKWTKELPGDGHSSPIIWKDHLYVTTSVRGQAGSNLLCLNKKTGDEIWRLTFESDHRKIHQFNTFASATPAVDSHHVYIAWSDTDSFQIAAIDHKGRGIWQRNLGTHHTQHGGGSSPIVFENQVLIANECRGPSAIHALDKMTGKSNWKIDRPWDADGKTSYSTPLVYRPESGAAFVVFNSTSSGMTAIQPDTGKVLWQLDDLFAKRTISSPNQVGELIFGSCGDGNVGFHLSAIRPPKNSAHKAEIVYQVRKSAPYVPTSVAKGNRVFLVSDGGIASCLDVSTGEEIWREKLGDTYFSSPIRVDDRIYAVSRRADVVVFKASDEFEILGRTLINQSTHATPIVDDGRLYLRTASHVYCLE